MSNWSEGTKMLGPFWPMMFITIACGAVSGFHSLCAGGTTCKQLSNERAARKVGYWAMLLESFLAVCVVCCLIAGLPLATYKGYCYPACRRRQCGADLRHGGRAYGACGIGPARRGRRSGRDAAARGLPGHDAGHGRASDPVHDRRGLGLLFGRYDVFAQLARQATPSQRGPVRSRSSPPAPAD